MTKAEIPRERMEMLLEALSCRFEDGRPAAAPKLRQEGGKKLFAAMPRGGGRQRDKSRANTSSIPVGESQGPATDTVQSPAKTLRAAQSPAEKPQLESIAEGGSRAASWSWADEAEEEEQRGERHPDGVPVRVPEAPAETAETPDARLEHGKRFGSQGRGRALLPFRTQGLAPTESPASAAQQGLASEREGRTLRGHVLE